MVVHAASLSIFAALAVFEYGAVVKACKAANLAQWRAAAGLLQPMT